MNIKIWGCRGSISVPGPNTVKYGGNTTCYEIKSSSGERLIIDAGTGIRELGNAVLGEMPLDTHLIFSHTHYDHVIGYPFFVPFFVPGNNFKVYGPALFNKSFRSVMTDLLSYSFFPVRLDEMAATMKFFDMKEETVEMGPFSVQAVYANHPVTTMAYRITCDGKTIIFTGDTEPYLNHLEGEEDVDPDDFEEVSDIIEEQNAKWLNFLNEADLVLYDAQYTEEEYPKFKGWGHTSMNVAVENCIKANVKKVVLTHHDPQRKDTELDTLETEWKNKVGDSIDLCFAQEGTTYDA
jgi:phosphoribosyl 1,2-cyclic phosphodiesterase